MVFEVMLVILMCAPLFVVWRTWERSNDLAERHHAHHDTYSVSPALLQVVAYASICSSCMGIVLGCLCATGSIPFDSIIVTVFFFCIFAHMCSYLDTVKPLLYCNL